jgi:release factor glutamine methyltransferase
MKTLGQILTLSYQYIISRNASIERHEVEELIAHILGMKRLDLYLNFERPMQEDELQKIRERLQRLAKGEPIQYIEGKCTFLGSDLKITPKVLIPRQETELIVEFVIEQLSKVDLKGKSLWDICTGSGCIGLAIKKKLPLLNVTLSDISEDALHVASFNAKLNNVQVELLQCNLFEGFHGLKADYIISNPPYVAIDDLDSLDPSVKNYEPQLALAGGVKGLDFYKRIAVSLRHFLHENGKAWFEIGSGQIDDVVSIFEQSGFKVSYVFVDYAQIPRAIEIIYK